MFSFLGTRQGLDHGVIEEIWADNRSFQSYIPKAAFEVEIFKAGW